MSKILVIGASRGIGLETVREALAAGHSVRALARGADRMPIEHEALEKMSGDATDPGDVEAALEGVDAVIQALGVGLNLRTMTGPVDLFSKATEVLVAAMERKGPRRLLVVTAIGCGDSVSAISSIEQLTRDMVMGPIIRDKNLQETLVRNSSLDWTLVRPSFLTWSPARRRYQVMVDPATWRNGMISRADVAHFLVSQVESDAYVRKGPVLAY
jgi:putative NADH-flavin reductase